MVSDDATRGILEAVTAFAKEFGLEWTLIFVLLAIIVYLFRRSEMAMREINEKNLAMIKQISDDGQKRDDRISNAIESASNRQVMALQQVQNVVSKLEGAFSVGFSRRQD